MTVDTGRRFFLRGRLSAASQAPKPPRPRPPWALAEAAFLERCTKCRACVDVCPERILSMGEGGFPEVSFSERGCTFCGQCAQACEPGALRREPDRTAWTWQPVVSQACLSHQRVECRVCGEACDASALRFPPRLGAVAIPVVDAQRCTGCGACVAPCPTGALTLQAPEGA